MIQKLIINQPLVFLLYAVSHETVSHRVHAGGQIKLYDCETDEKYAAVSYSQWSNQGPMTPSANVSPVFAPRELSNH